MSPVVLAVLLPHAPVLVEPVGGRRARDAERTVTSMRAIARRVVAVVPDSVVIISPHSPRRRGSFGCWMESSLKGDFSQFQASEVSVTLPNDLALAAEIAAQAKAAGLTVWEIADHPLDHGALVPLWFLAEAGWHGPTVILSLNYPHEDGLTELGEAVSRAGGQRGQRLAVVASGDMSHSLQPGAPCGFHPRAKEFDRQFIRQVRAGRLKELLHFDAELQELASEDVVDSTLVAAAAAGWRTDGHEVLSYEGPFGVGYGVAVLFDSAPAKDPGGEQLPRLARASVEAVFTGQGKPPAPASTGFLAQQQGVFVTLRQRNGELRGCVGTLTPKSRNVAEETWRMAREAAFEDTRFSPLERQELADLRFEVSVLHELEPVDSPDDLDPARYGLVITTPDGRRAALLPGIAEVDTVEEQLRITRRKGRIGEAESIRIQRFEVDHFEEPA